jgi:hypothetical protein
MAIAAFDLYWRIGFRRDRVAARTTERGWAIGGGPVLTRVLLAHRASDVVIDLFIGAAVESMLPSSAKDATNETPFILEGPASQ